MHPYMNKSSSLREKWEFQDAIRFEQTFMWNKTGHTILAWVLSRLIIDVHLNENLVSQRQWDQKWIKAYA